jgi:Protein of unknown function (DUF3551)
MRLLLFILGICIGIVAVANSAEAQNYPWCSYYMGPAGGENCGFTTFQQCLDNVRGIGGFCEPNTQYQPSPGSHPSTRVYRRYPY